MPPPGSGYAPEQVGPLPRPTRHPRPWSRSPRSTCRAMGTWYEIAPSELVPEEVRGFSQQTTACWSAVRCRNVAARPMAASPRRSAWRGRSVALIRRGGGALRAGWLSFPPIVWGTTAFDPTLTITFAVAEPVSTCGSCRARRRWRRVLTPSRQRCGGAATDVGRLRGQGGGEAVRASSHLR